LNSAPQNLTWTADSGDIRRNRIEDGAGVCGGVEGATAE
jgi:hypothetical protein